MLDFEVFLLHSYTYKEQNSLVYKEIPPAEVAQNLFLTASIVSNRLAGPLGELSQTAITHYDALDAYLAKSSRPQIDEEIDEIETLAVGLTGDERRETIARQIKEFGIVPRILQEDTKLSGPKLRDYRRGWHASFDAEKFSEMRYEHFIKIISDRMENLLLGKIVSLEPSENTKVESVFIPDSYQAGTIPVPLIGEVTKTSAFTGILEIVTDDKHKEPYTVAMFGDEPEKDILKVELKILDENPSD